MSQEELETPKTFSTEAVFSADGTTQPLGLPDLIGLTLERNLRLGQVGWAVETARGRVIQAGLYSNPTLSVTGNKLGDRQRLGSIWTAPYLQQKIVTGNKLSLSKAAALKEVDQAAWTVVAERYRIFTDMRQNFLEVVTLQQRTEILGELIGLTEKSVENANKRLKAKVGVLQVQRAMAEARLEYLRSLGEMWQAASEIAGLMLEDHWPLAPAAPVAPPPERKQL